MAYREKKKKLSTGLSWTKYKQDLAANSQEKQRPIELEGTSSRALDP